MAKRILLVDDDVLLRRSLAFNRAPPDLVLLDIGLPGMDGLDALRHLKENLNLPVVFLTARRRELDEVLGLELGADDYITKPFDVDVLLAHIKAVLRRT
jgi:DNA-binding response OmpR family regulator